MLLHAERINRHAIACPTGKPEFTRGSRLTKTRLGGSLAVPTRGAMMTKNAPIRILTAVPICDGHDSAINTINLEFIRHGIEVIYLGYHRSVGDIVRAAIQEDV